jgi:protocatechuate 3,4-dioxygenase beta subunit
MWRISLLTLVFSTLCFPQSVPPNARIGGRVTGQSGQPLEDATLSLMGNNRTPAGGAPPAYSTTSNANGDFSFAAVEPNTYRLLVQRRGYLDDHFTFPDGKVVIPAAAGEQKHLEVKLTPQSVISGRVTNADGEPISGATVTVFRMSRANGSRQLDPLRPIPAGTDGSFSIGKLREGRYYVAASAEKFATTYFPASLDAATAARIDIAPGTEVRNTDIRMQRAAAFHIQGKIVNESGATVPAATVSMHVPGVITMFGTTRIQVVDGTFRFDHLSPGTYILQSIAGPRRELQAHETVTLADHDIDDAVMTLVPALDIPFSVKIDGVDEQEAQAIRNSLGRFTLTTADGLNENAMAVSQNDGTWLFRSIGLGTYRMGLSGPDGTYVKSIRYGNQDVTQGLLDTTHRGGTLEMILAPGAAEVTGIVTDSNGQPLPGFTVTLWVPGSPAPGTIDQAVSTRTDAMGSFRFGRLRPGEYRIAAWEEIEPGMSNIAEFHSSFDSSATAVKVSAGSHQTLQPALISREKIRAATARLP